MRKPFLNKILVVLVLLFPVSLFAQVGGEAYLYGLADLKYGKYEEALSCLTKFVESDASEKDFVSYDIARCHAELGNDEEAIAWLKIHLGSKYKLPVNKIKTDKAFDNIQNSDGWNDLWMNDWYNQNENLLAEAEYLLSKKEYYQALDILDDLIYEKKAAKDALVMRARVYEAMQDNNSAVQDYTSAINAQKKNFKYLEERGELYQRMGKSKKALEDFNSAIEINPLALEAYYMRSKARNDLGQNESALEDIMFYLKYMENDDAAYHQAGKICFDMGSYIEALPYFNKALELNKTNSKYFVSRGDTYLQTKTYKQADNDYTMALDLMPRQGDVYYKRGLIKLSQNDIDAACMYWKKAKMYGCVKSVDQLEKYCTGIE